MIHIKICGMTRVADITLANTYQPDCIGFVFAQSKRQITKETARVLKQQLAGNISAVGVFVNQPKEDIACLLEEGIIDMAQLHGQENESDIVYLQKRTHKPVIKAISVRTLTDILAWKETAADYLLFDQGNGGTGKPFSWEILRQLKEHMDFHKPFWIAGGLRVGNIEEALTFAPFGVDVSSSAERDGVKDGQAMQQMIACVRGLEDIQKGNEHG